jgi:regulator of replication initiation timing
MTDQQRQDIVANGLAKGKPFDDAYLELRQFSYYDRRRQLHVSKRGVYILAFSKADRRSFDQLESIGETLVTVCEFVNKSTQNQLVNSLLGISGTYCSRCRTTAHGNSSCPAGSRCLNCFNHGHSRRECKNETVCNHCRVETCKFDCTHAVDFARRRRQASQQAEDRRSQQLQVRNGNVQVRNSNVSVSSFRPPAVRAEMKSEVTVRAEMKSEMIAMFERMSIEMTKVVSLQITSQLSKLLASQNQQSSEVSDLRKTTQQLVQENLEIRRNLQERDRKEAELRKVADDAVRDNKRLTEELKQLKAQLNQSGGNKTQPKVPAPPKPPARHEFAQQLSKRQRIPQPEKPSPNLTQKKKSRGRTSANKNLQAAFVQPMQVVPKQGRNHEQKNDDDSSKNSKNKNISASKSKTSANTKDRSNQRDLSEPFQATAPASAIARMV